MDNTLFSEFRSIRQLRRITFLTAAFVVISVFCLYSPVHTALNDPLTPEERQWLNRHDGRIVLGHDPSAKPIDFYDEQGQFRGLAADYVHLLEEKLHFRFKLSRNSTWKEVVDKARNREIDVLCSFTKTPDREEWMLFTPPYFEVPAIILTRNDLSGPLQLDQMRGKKITFTKGWVIDDYLRKNYGYLDFVPAIDEEHAIQAVSIGQADVVVTALTTAMVTIEKYKITNLHIVGDAGYSFELAMASRKDWPILNSILTKGLDLITNAEQKAIYKKWITMEQPSLFYSKKFWSFVLIVFGIAGGGILVIYLWNRGLQSQVAEKTAALQREIEERKKAEASLYQTNAILQAAMDQSPAGIAIADAPDGTLRYVNDAGLLIRGRDRETVINGAGIKEYVTSWHLLDLDGTPLNSDEVPLARAILYGEINSREFIVRRDDDEDRIVLANAAPIKNEAGEIVAGIVVFDDITKRKQAEIKRELDEDRLQSLLMLHEKKTLKEKDLLKYALEEAVRLTESKCGYLHFVEDDEKHICLTLWSQETMTMCTAEKTLHYPLDQAGIWADSVRQRRAVAHNDYEDEPERKGLPDGHFPIKRHMSVPVYDDNKIVAIVGVGNKEQPYGEGDQRQLTLYFANTWGIIKQKRYEEEKNIIAAQLQQAQKMEAIGTLAGGIAHDFNNILGTILGYADMAKDDAPPGSNYHRDLEKILLAANRAKDLVKQILAFSRQAKIDRMPLKMQPLIREGLKMLRSSIPTTISITEDLDPRCGTVFADPTHIHQILMNLCVNAYHAMEQTGGALSVSLKNVRIGSGEEDLSLNLPDGEYNQLTVADTGCGIGPDIVAKIFDPFFTTKEPGKGTGMGLSIIHGIMAEYGGKITVDSQLGQGTTFRVYFPVVHLDVDTEQQKSADAPTGKERLLFVDDEEILADMGKEMLSRLGYHVTVRQGSFEALTTFQNAPEDFDLVITDQTMPGMTGSDLARRMLQIRPDIPIILCTGYSNLIDEASAKAMGIKAFTLKPLTKSAIATLIRTVLEDDA